MDYEADNTFENALKRAKFNDKTFLFFKNLTDDNSETQGDIVKSYHKAGYTENKTSKYRAYAIYRSKKFQNVLTEYRIARMKKAENRKETAIERVLRRNEEIFSAAETRTPQDLSTMKACNEFDAKINGLLADRHIIETDNPLQLSADVQAQALEEAHRMLLNPGQETIPADDDREIIDAEFISNNEESLEDSEQENSEEESA